MALTPGVGPVASNTLDTKRTAAASAAAAAVTTVTTEMVSAGGNITLPVGTTVLEALQIIMDAADPDLG